MWESATASPDSYLPIEIGRPRRIGASFFCFGVCTSGTFESSKFESLRLPFAGRAERAVITRPAQ